MGIFLIEGMNLSADKQLLGLLALQSVVIIGWETILNHVVVVTEWKAWVGFSVTHS